LREVIMKCVFERSCPLVSRVLLDSDQGVMESIAQLHKKGLLKLFNAGIDAVRPSTVINNSVSLDAEILDIAESRYDLGNYRRIYLVGAGKASAFMAKAVEGILGERITAGIINVKYGHASELKRCKVNECGHPVPDQNGVTGTREIFELVESADKKTLVICLISGGGSALLAFPANGISLHDLREVNRLLLECGANITEINTVRKHLSQSKGGRLALAAFPAEVVTLIISDVIGDRLDTIASGPTVPDPTTYADAIRVLEKYKITHRVPRFVMANLRDGCEGRLPETPKPGQKEFSKVRSIIVANNELALEAVHREAEEMGLKPSIVPVEVQGEAREAARRLVEYVKRAVAHKGVEDRPRCFISGGETTVTVRGPGKGGRNMEFALAAASELERTPGIAMLSCGSDGSDGPTDAAGAYCDHTTISRARQKGLRPQFHLGENDSYSFFAKLGDLIVTGPTGTNVMDIQITLVN
jgi:hydroxypyruvate reductase